MRNNSIDMASLFLQLVNLDILFKDFNNSDLMRELQNQDEIYFKTIIKQNEKIIKLLEGRESDGRNND